MGGHIERVRPGGVSAMRGRAGLRPPSPCSEQARDQQSRCCQGPW